MKHFKRWIRIILEFGAVFAGVILIVFLLLVWRVSSQPMSSETLTPYVEAAIGRLLPNTRAQISHMLIEWDNTDYSIAMHGKEVTLRDRRNIIIAEFPDVRVKLSALGLLRGRFVPAELEINKPHLWFVRRSDGTMWFGGEPAGGQLASPSEEGLSFLDALKHIASEVTRRGQFRELVVTEAVVSINDQETGQDYTVNMPQVALEHGWRKITGIAKIGVIQKGKISFLEAHYVYEHSLSQHKITVKFSDINPYLFSGLHPKLNIIGAVDLPVTGETEIVTDRELSIIRTAAHVKGEKGKLNIPEFWDNPRLIDAIKIDGIYERQKQNLEITAAEIDFGGPKLSLQIKAEKPSAESTNDRGKPFDMAFAAEIKLSDLPMDQYAAVWPKPIISNAREWISENMSHGVFKQGNVTLRGKFRWDDLENMLLDSGSGKISAANGTVKYMEGMPPVAGVNAEATFDLDHMDINVSGGGIGAIKLHPSVIRMTDFQKNTQYIDIPVKISAPVRDIIKLIDEKPLGYAKAAGLRPEDCEGTAEGTLELKFPLLKLLSVKDIDIKANASLNNFGVRKIARELDLSQGNMALELDAEGFSLKGPAALNKIPINLEYESRFSVDKTKPYRQALIIGNISGEQLGMLGEGLANKVKGPIAVKLSYVQPDKTNAKFSGNINLKQSFIQFDDLAWKKATGIPAELNFDLEIPDGKNIAIKNVVMQGTGLNVKGNGTLDKDTLEILDLNLKPLIIGRTNASLHFSQTQGPGGKLSFSVVGESLDVSGLTGGKDPARSDPRVKEYKINVNDLITSETGHITNLNAHALRDLQGWDFIELHGKADGGHQLDISLAHKNGRRIFSLACDDFGKALKGMGFTDTVKDGPIEISGESSSANPRVIEGEVKIGHFVVAGLPVLARLLSAVSPFGFIDLVTGNASFDRLDGEFRWRGDEVELTKIRAVGSVFGLNIEGRVDLNTGESHLNGTLVPFSLMNRIIGNIPLVGDVITGGEGGGVLAVNYTIKGPLRDPQINVNPVSILTPGFLRNLFFAQDSEDNAASDDEQPNMVKPK